MSQKRELWASDGHCLTSNTFNAPCRWHRCQTFVGQTLKRQLGPCGCVRQAPACLRPCQESGQANGIVKGSTCGSEATAEAFRLHAAGAHLFTLQGEQAGSVYGRHMLLCSSQGLAAFHTSSIQVHHSTTTLVWGSHLS